MSQPETYQRLRPRTEIERCECQNVESLLLIDRLTDNPIHCGNCRCEIDPERLQLSVSEVDRVVDWRDASTSLYRLWLDSGEYESYAKARLLDPQGEINARGREIAQLLSSKWPTRFWYFFDPDDGDPTNCPMCDRPLNLDVKWGTGCCDRCFLQI